MSCIAFHTEHGDDVLIRGWERAWMGQVVNRTAAAYLPDRLGDYLETLASDGSYGDMSDADGTMVRAVMAHGYRPVFQDRDGNPLESFDLQLNTALTVGNDEVCLLARLHGQCEIHCYVEGPNRAWMADIIDRGRESGLYRRGAGWLEVAELLRSADDEPVVTSHSVCESFPTHTLHRELPPVWKPTRIDKYGEAVWDDWYDLVPADRWRLAMEGLRSLPERQMELRPDNLRAKYGHGKSLIDLFVRSPAAKVSS